jgi:hypothetical protein
LINSFSPKGLARLAEGFNPALKLGEVIYPSPFGKASLGLLWQGKPWTPARIPQNPQNPQNTK